MSTGDWCQGLKIVPAMGGGIMIANTNFFQTPAKFVMGTIDFDVGGMYTSMLTAISESHAHLSQACLQAYGATTDCAGLQAALKAGTNPNYNAEALTCNTASNGDGCDCDVQLGDSGSDTGAWALDSTQTVVYQTSTNAGSGPKPASFCVSADNNHLTLSGYNGGSLAGSPNGGTGLRTLTAFRTAP
jgi:hypothetical protein